MLLQTLLKDQNGYVRFYLSMHIRLKRETQGVSVAAIAAELGLTEQSYNKIEAGRMRLNEELLQNIIRILTLEEEDLIEICRISNIAYANSIAKELSPNYPA